MRKSLLFGAMLLVASCTVQKEEEFESPLQYRYHAVAEEPVDAETRVYADKNLRVRWNEGDRISIFERRTYNQEYEFLGDNGDTAGDFDPVESSGYHTSDEIADGHVYAVYPYDKKNKCDYEGKLTVTFPSVQHYKKDSFGVGANVMVAKTNTLDLRFMHVGGYRTFKLYGEGVSVSSVRIESNGSEYLAGRTDVVLGEDGKPEISFIESTSNSKSVELVCDTPVTLGATAAEAVEFWFVLPPGTLAQGFTVTITDENGNEFTKSTSNSIEIKSGVKKSMPAFEVEIEHALIQPDNEIWYTTSNQSIFNYERGRQFGAAFISNTYENGKGTIKFDGPVTMIAEKALSGSIFSNSYVTSLALPNSVRELGAYALFGLQNLESLSLPNGLLFIQNYAISGCNALTTLAIPESVVDIASGAIVGCSSLEGFSGKFVSDDNRYIIINNEIRCFAEGNLLDTNIVIPESILSIGSAFRGSHITGIKLNSRITTIDDLAFYGCNQLETVSFIAPLSSIGQQCFDYCYNLRSFVGPNASTDGKMLIIDDVACAFAMAYSSFTLPEGVVNLDYLSVFNIAQNRIKELSFPSTINSDSYLYLPDLEGLERISFSLATIPNLNLPVNSSKTIDVVVPICMVDAYKSVLGEYYYYDYNLIGDVSRMKNNILYSSRLLDAYDCDDFEDYVFDSFSESDFGANAISRTAIISYDSDGDLYTDVLIRFDSEISCIMQNARVFYVVGPYINGKPHKIWIPETTSYIEGLPSYSYDDNEVFIYFLGSTPPDLESQFNICDNFHFLVPQAALNAYKSKWPYLVNRIETY